MQYVVVLNLIPVNKRYEQHKNCLEFSLKSVRLARDIIDLQI